MLKKNFNGDFSPTVPGPYYDSYHNHVHVWKSSNLIKNFRGSQSQDEKTLTQNLAEKGVYCCICHQKLNQTNYNYSVPDHSIFFKKRESCDKLVEKLSSLRIKNDASLLWDRFYCLLVKKYYNNMRVIYNHLLMKKQRNTDIARKWMSLSFKICNQPQVYHLTPLLSLYIKPNEMTPYQRFRLKNPNYKKDVSFIVTNDKFTRNYSSF
jgi:hypothetical protein